MTVTAVIPTEVHDVHLRLSYRSGGCGRCFPEWTTWFADARAGRLRPSCVGGVPIEVIDPEVTAALGVPPGAAVTSAATCRNGHPRTPENAIVRGKKRCRPCVLDQGRRWRERNPDSEQSRPPRTRAIGPETIARRREARVARDRDARWAEIWQSIDRSSGDCWPWPGCIDRSQGYGTVSFMGRVYRAHRLVYEAVVGPIPSGLTLDHMCHNTAVTRGDCSGGPACPHRRCVNPAHLEPATSRDNTLRGATPTALNAAKTHCIRGHAFDEANTYWTGVGRACRTCSAQRGARRHQTREPRGPLQPARAG